MRTRWRRHPRHEILTADAEPTSCGIPARPKSNITRRASKSSLPDMTSNGAAARCACDTYRIQLHITEAGSTQIQSLAPGTEPVDPAPRATQAAKRMETGCE